MTPVKIPSKCVRARAVVLPCSRCSLQTLRQKRGSALAPRAVSTELDDIEIDPTTGEPVINAQCRGPRPRDYVQAGALKWAYRVAPGLGDTSDKLPILMLHGIGSSSYSWRELMSTFSEAGHTCYAPDWPGCGSSDKPSPSQFAYDEAAYVKALEEFVTAINLKGPYYLITHGFVLGQYGLLWALGHADDIAKLVIINTPLGVNTKLRPELAVYKNPVAFLRPKPESKFAGDIYNASGLAFVMKYADAQAYDLPYQEDPAASVAVATTMEKCDFKALLTKVDSAYCSWRVPTALLFGNADPFLDVRDAMKFLDTKRTTMQMTSVEGKLGHCPQEDFSASFADLLLKYFDGGDIRVRGITKPTKQAIKGSNV